MEGPLLRLIGDTRPEDDAALGVGLGGVLAGLLPLPPPPPPTPPFFSTPLVESLLAPPFFFAGEGVIVEKKTLA